jgi:multiple sugar transport system substrate-binding protein
MTFPFPKSLTSVPSTPVPGTLLLLGILFVLSAKAEDPGVTLHIFAGGAGERTNVLRSELDRYEHVHTGIKVLYNTGGATSELQRRYLSTLLEARDTGYDAFVVDVVNPAEYAAAGWIEPLDSYLGGPAGSSLDAYLPSERQVNVVDGKVFALPWVTDAQFLFYRSDLLKKYGLRPPLDWDELAADAQRVVAGEKDPQLFGLSIQGAPIEGTVCTFLFPTGARDANCLTTAIFLSTGRPRWRRSAFGVGYLSRVFSRLERPRRRPATPPTSSRPAMRCSQSTGDPPGKPPSTPPTLRCGAARG